MYKFLIMLILFLAAQIALGKSLFEYNTNPEYDLLTDGARSYSNFWLNSEFYSPDHRRYKHYAKPGHGRGYQNSGYGGHPSLSFDYSDHHHFHQSSEEYGDGSDISYDYPQHHQQNHGFPPGQAKKHGLSGLPPGQAKKHGASQHPHDPPRRFPPPPVYDKDFIDPWAVPATTPQPFTVQQPPLTTPAIYIAPKLTTRRTTPSPITSTTSDDQLIYDIDVRFGRD